MKKTKGIKLAAFCLIPSVGYPLLVFALGLILHFCSAFFETEQIGNFAGMMLMAWFVPPAVASMLFFENRSITGLSNGVFRGEFGIGPDGLAGWTFTFFFWLCVGFIAWLIVNTLENNHNQAGDDNSE